MDITVHRWACGSRKLHFWGYIFWRKKNWCPYHYRKLIFVTIWYLFTLEIVWAGRFKYFFADFSSRYPFPTGNWRTFYISAVGFQKRGVCAMSLPQFGYNYPTTTLSSPSQVSLTFNVLNQHQCKRLNDGTFHIVHEYWLFDFFCLITSPTTN